MIDVHIQFYSQKFHNEYFHQFKQVYTCILMQFIMRLSWVKYSKEQVEGEK